MKINILKYLFVLFICMVTSIYSQPFNATTNSFVNVSSGYVDFGDYNNDGYLDILLTGSDIAYNRTHIFKNDGDGTFTYLQLNLLEISGSAKWGDYDNDGDLDILLSGASQNATGYTRIYRNDGNDSFTAIWANLIGLKATSVDWGDYDNDGDLDILSTGIDNSWYKRSFIYRNEGNGAFTNIYANLTGISAGVAQWGDYDNDCDLDIIISGLSNTKLYRNNGNETFTNVNSGISGESGSSLDWGDYDNDGDLDIIVAYDSLSKIYRNDGNEIFTDINANLGVNGSSAAWGDTDNDGDLDLIIAGIADTIFVTKFYRNDGNDVFTEINSGIIGVVNSHVAMGDYDNDNDLDIFVTGYTGWSNVAILYRNDNNIHNQAPSSPIYLTSTSYIDSVILEWVPQNDNQTPISGLNYNLIVGTNSSALDIMSPHSDETTCFRRIASIGNGQMGAKWKLKNLPVGKYFWNVQSIDAGYLASDWAVESSFIVYDTLFKNITTGMVGVSGGDVKWGDYDDDGDIDVFMSNKIYRNDGAGIFTDINANIAGGKSIDLGDYDNDGDLDILLAGSNPSKIFKNEGNDIFTDLNLSIFIGLHDYGAWGDYDNDGDLDIFMTPFNRLYRNNGNDSFTNVGFPLIATLYGSVNWFDYNNDGYLDVLMTGLSAGNLPVTKIIQNNGGGNFYDINANLLGVYHSSSDVGDYDNDGDYDILLNGISSFGDTTLIYRNDNNGIFTNINANMLGVITGAAIWGDYDNDGDLDAFSTGYPFEKTGLYKNVGNDAFENTYMDLPGINGGSAAWGDYDNDNDLDLVIVGSGETPHITALYRNESLLYNTIPDAPLNLNAETNPDSIILNWDASTDNETPSVGLNYNVRIRMAGRYGDIVPGHSNDSTGYRHIVKNGNSQKGHPGHFIIYQKIVYIIFTGRYKQLMLHLLVHNGRKKNRLQYMILHLKIVM